MMKQAPKKAKFVRIFHFRMQLNQKWIKQKAGEEFRFPNLSTKKQEFTIAVSAHEAILRTHSHTTVVNIDSGKRTVFDHADKSKRDFPCKTESSPTSDADLDWDVCQLSDQIQVRSAAFTLVYSSGLIDMPSRTLDYVWQLLLPGVPKKYTPNGLPTRMKLYTSAGDKVLDLKLLDDESGDQDLLKGLNSFKPAIVKPFNPFEKIKPEPLSRPDSGRQLRINAARSRRRHAARGIAVDAAWMLKQPVLDQIKDLFNSISRKLEKFQNPADGSLGIQFDLWPILETILDDGNFDEVPGYTNSFALKNNLLFPAMVLLEVYHGRMPVLANRSPGGMQPSQVRDYLTWLADAISSGIYEDKVRRTRSFFDSRVFSPIRNKNIGRAQLAHMLNLKVVARDSSGAPLKRYTGQLPDTDDETRLMRYELKNFELGLEINHHEILERLEFVDDHVEFDMTIPNLTFGADFSTNALSSLLSISLTFLTGGAWAIWLDNQGDWSASLSATVAFDLIPVVVGGASDEKIEMAVVFNNDRSDFSWRAEPLFTDNPFNSEVIWLTVLLAERFFDWTGEWDDDLMNLVTVELDKFFREALRWPDVWHALEGPRTTAAAPHFDSMHGVWKSSILPDGFRVPTSFATSLDVEKADPLAIAISERYIESWLRSRLISEHGDFPYNTPLSPTRLAMELGGRLPPAESLEADNPDYEEPVFNPFENYERDRCPDPPPPLPPETRYQAVMVRSEPRITLPSMEKAAYVADFEMDYWARISAVRTWQIPVLVGSGYDCLPEPGVNLIPGNGAIPPIDPMQIIKGLDRGIFDFAGVDFDKFVSQFASISGQSGFGSFGSGQQGLVPIPPVPPPSEPGSGQLPDQQSRFCTIDCTWAYEAERRNIGTFLQVHGKVSGKLILDFDPNFYGDDGSGILEGPIPGLRLSVLRDGNALADLDAEIISLQLDGTLTNLSADRVHEYFMDTFITNAHALFDGLVYEDAPQTKMAIFPRSRGTEAIPLDNVIRTFNWARNLISYQQAADGEAPEYIVEGNMVYWPIILKDGVRSFIGED